MAELLLDAADRLVIEPVQHANEVRTLQMLQHGLMSLATAIKRREMRYAEVAKKMRFSFFGGTSDEENADLNLVSCMFHWFGVSVCNYARLVGFIRGLTNKEVKRDDLHAPEAFPSIKQAVKRYVDSIPELAPVLVWRNKVAGHFAITDPHKADNIATLNMSVMFPVTVENGTYFVGAYTLTQGNAAGSHRSVIPMWSVTQVFESLIPRYWPDLKFVTPETESAPNAEATPP